MLTKLLPEQISKFWDIIKYAVEQSLPPTVSENEDMMNGILSAALSGRVEVWASYKRDENKVKFEGIMLTEFLIEGVSNSKNLLIYSLYGYERTERRTWLTGLLTLAKYAKSRRCGQIIAYTAKEELVSLANRLGANTDYTLISFDVNEIVQKLNKLDGE